MLLTIICLVIVFLLGRLACRFFIGSNVSATDLFLVSIIVGLVIMSFFVFILAIIIGNLSAAVYSFTVVGAIISIVPLRDFIIRAGKLKGHAIAGTISCLKKIKWFAVLFIGLMFILFIDLFKKTLSFDKWGYWAANEGIGDIPFHMNSVSYFIYNNPFALENPIYSGTSMAYHFMVDFLSACFYVLNKNYIFSFHLPTIILGLVSIILLYSIISKIIKQTYIRICAFLIFFLGSGVGFLRIFNDNNIPSQKGISEFFNYILHLPYSLGQFFVTQYPDQNILWGTFLTTSFMHQRAFIFGLPVVLTCITIIYSLSKNSTDIKGFYLLGFLAGVLPLVQIYSFIAVFIIVFAFLIASLIVKKKDLVFGTLKSLALSIIVALPSFIFLFSVEKSAGIRLRLGWMMGSFTGVNLNPQWKIHIFEWLDFIWLNSGLLLPLLFAAILYIFLAKKIRKEKDIFILSLVFSSLLLWLLLNTVQLQTWDFDNYKIYAYFILLGAMLAGFFFDKLSLKWKIIPVIILTSFLTASGVVIVLSHSSIADPKPAGIYNENDMAIAEWIIKETLPSDRILTAPDNINPVSSLAGRPVILGHFMWVWPHGLDWGERYGEIQKMYQSPGTSAGLFKKYDITYVYMKDKERGELKADEKFFDENFPVVFTLNNVKIYKIDIRQENEEYYFSENIW